MNIFDVNKEIRKNEDTLYIKESESKVMGITKKLFSGTYNKAKMTLNKAAKDMMSYFKKHDLENDVIDIINRYLGMDYRSMNQLTSTQIRESLNEGFSEWFKEAKLNAYGALAFYPLLTMFLEFDKLIKGNPDASLKVTLTYFVIWLGVITGKVVSGKLSQKTKIKALGSKT